MKEDSLEIYMELLENLIEYSENFYKQNGRSPIFLRKNQVALKHILSDYKRVLKENEEFKRLHIQDNKHLDFIMQHSIPVQKIKDIIDRIDYDIKKRLQELLESEE